MLLAHFRSYFTKNIIYNITRGVSFYLNMVLRVKILEDWSFSKHLPQLGKNFPNIRSLKTKFFHSAYGICKIGLSQFFIVSTTIINFCYCQLLHSNICQLKPNHL